ncbi:MAG: thioesterase [Fusicatenibacter sp.]|nr:thioesterase [Lachnospiraceae bacterium]MDY2938923.1 thioesterase [Fusicatenibacter sp.]
MKYYFDSRIRYSEIGENGKLTILGLINYFQDCSTFQSEELGMGVEYLKNLNRAWLLSSWQIRIKRLPSLGEAVRTGTWAYGYRGFTGMRNFVMETASGEQLACANSIWAYVDITSGKPVRVTENVVKAYGQEEPLEEEFGERKIRLAEEMEAQESFIVRPHHLDTNHHVNNGQYISMAAEYLPKQMEVHRLRAEYKQQAHLNDTLYPLRGWMENSCLIALNDENGAPYVVVEFQ